MGPLTQSTLLLTLLPTLTLAHFHLHFPAPRGDDTAEQATFPCGGYASVSDTRTPVSLTSIPLSMELGHETNLISVFLAIGNDPSSNFSIELWPTVDEVGLGDFCWESVPIPASAGITEGTNATVQIVTNGHGGSGLYNCADLTFTADTARIASPESCTNNTGITAEFFSGTTFANTTVPEEDHEGGHADNASASATDAAASATSTTSAGAGAIATAAGWGVLGAGVMGVVALL